MAHIAKYKQHSVGHMLAHYRRDPSSFERDNINPDFIGENYDLVFDEDAGSGSDSVGVRRTQGVAPNWAVVKAKIDEVDERQRAAGKRATRSDAVVLADLVVTAPANLREEDGERFFAACLKFLGSEVGNDNVLGCFVHRDEMKTRKTKDEQGNWHVEWTGERVRDHAHIPFTPILDGKFNFKKMWPRARYQTLHKRLNEYVDKELGYHVAIQLDEAEKVQQVYADKTSEIDAVRAAVEQQTSAARAELEKVMGEITSAVEEKERAERAADAAKIRQNTAETRAKRAKTELDGIRGEIKQANTRLESVQVQLRTAELDYEEDEIEHELALDDSRRAEKSVRYEFEQAEKRNPAGLGAFLRGLVGKPEFGLLERVIEGFKGIWERLTRPKAPKREHVRDWVPEPQRPSPEPEFDPHDIEAVKKLTARLAKEGVTHGDGGGGGTHL